MSKPRPPDRRTDRQDAMKPLPGRDLMTMALRQNTIHVVSDGDRVSYVNFFTGTGVMTVEEFEHAVRMSQVARRRREENTDAQAQAK